MFVCCKISKKVRFIDKKQDLLTELFHSGVTLPTPLRDSLELGVPVGEDSYPGPSTYQAARPVTFFDAFSSPVASEQVVSQVV